MTTQFQIHWTNGHHQGWSPLTYTEQEAAAIIKARQATEPGSVFELVPAKAEEG